MFHFNKSNPDPFPLGKFGSGSGKNADLDECLYLVLLPQGLAGAEPQVDMWL